MRTFVVIFLGVLAGGGCFAASAEDISPIGSKPDPGLEGNASEKSRVPGAISVPEKAKAPAVAPVPKRPPSRAAKPDGFDDPIVELPQGELHLNHLEPAPKTADGAAKPDDWKIETLIYDITVNKIPAGRAEFELRHLEKFGKANALPAFTASMTIRANRATALFYDVRDNASSILDAKGGFSRVFRMDRKEGNTKVAERIAFTYDKECCTALYERPRPDAEKDAKWVGTTIPLPCKSLDPLTAIYFMRTFGNWNSEKAPVARTALNLKDIQTGKSKPAIVLPICTDRHIWNAKLFKVGEDHPEVGSYQNRACVVLEVEAPFRGLFEHVGKIRIWVDVETGIIAKMSAEIPIGPAEALLNVDESKNLPFVK